MSTTTATLTATAIPGARANKIRAYRDFLTPSLHRRFIRAGGVALVACYVEAILLGDKSSYFWLWFPLGWAGLRTLLLFISTLMLLFLRVTHLRFGATTAVSPIAAFMQLVNSFDLLRTISFYLVSAWWFSEVYVWSANEESGLSWVVPDDGNGRDRLNERPIFLRSNLAFLALAMASAHLYYDYDVIEIQQYPALEGPQKPAPSKPAIMVLSSKLQESLRFAVTAAASMTIVNFVLYAAFFRRFAWAWSLWFGRLIWDIPRSAEPSIIPPYHYTLIFRAFTSSILLACLWQVSNLAFSTWASEPPLKLDRPLTAESRDPNGSLISGLVAKKPLAKTSALWELSIISSSFEERRKTIFAEIDRPGGASTWKQILDVCLALLEATNIRLEDNRVPPPELTLAVSREKEVKSLPRLSAPLKADLIFQASSKPSNRTQRIESEIGAFAKSIGQSPSKVSSNMTSPARKFLERAGNQILTPNQQKSLQPEELLSSVNSLASQFLNTVVGVPFRQTFAARVQAKVFGSPRSELPALLFAVHSISRLAVAGITEDAMGTVNRDIPLIMRTFGNAIGRIQKFVKESGVHWTDTNFASAGEHARRVEEVEFLTGYLRTALRHIIQEYEGYARDMGISPSELKAVRAAAGLDH